MADTANIYTVAITNGTGTTISNGVNVKYVIVAQPVDVFVATGTSASFTVKTSTVATSYLWFKNGSKMDPAIFPTYTNLSVALNDSGSYTVRVGYNGGTCMSSAAYLKVENLPIITSQPQAQVLCDTTIKSATFSLTNAASQSTLTYQWYKNGTAITGAKSSSYTANNLKMADTANTYYAILKNSIGTTTSNTVGFKYIILSQPQPTSLYVATGTSASFTVKASSIVTGYLWYRNGSKMDPAIFPTYNNASVALNDSGSYTVKVSYLGGSCMSNAATLKVENRPIITMQPQAQVLCDTTIKSTTFTLANAASQSSLTYQWYKNGAAITGATANSYTASNLTLADTSNTYYAVLTNGIGSTTSNSVGFKYLIISQPANLYVIAGTTSTFNVHASSVATSYQWFWNNNKIDKAITATYINLITAQADSGSYTVKVYYNNNNNFCTSTAAMLTVDAPPVVIAQPQIAQLCNATFTSATFNVTAKSPYSAMTYQWLKNGLPIAGATASSYTATGLGFTDTTSSYSVKLTNNAGITTSNAVNAKYVIVTQPKATTVVTGNPATFTIKISGATAVQWYRSGSSINNATGQSYNIPVVNTTDSTTFTAMVTYSGGTCLSNGAKLTPATIVYSKTIGLMNTPATWGASQDGSGSSPVDFTRSEHTFVIANRDTLTSVINMTIAGTLDIKNSKLTVAPNVLLTAGRIIRTGTTGVIAGSSTSSIKLTGITNTAYAGASDLYFDAANNTIKALYTANHTVNLRSALNLTAGTIAGMLQVNSGTFNTNDFLTLKSNASGTAFVYRSLGVINGKATVEKFFPARRAYRFICSPVAANGAPSINAAWQEGATSSKDNPKPGYGTHITYGAEADGYDQNPQKSFSMYVLKNNSWTGVPPTKTTKVTDYPAYMFFVRGDRSYNIATTTSTTTPTSTILRTTGNLNQGPQPNVTVAATGYTLVANPYASLIDFDLILKTSQNLKSTARIWDPALAGIKGVGAYVTVDWTSTGYITTPPSDVKNLIPAGQGFWVQSADNKNPGILRIDESAKYLPDVYAPSYNNYRKSSNRESVQESMLEIDLSVFNEDGSTGIADGVLYHFANEYSNDVDENDVDKLKNIYENLSISNNGNLLTVERRTAPAANDTLQLNFTGQKTANYQLLFVPKSFENISVGNLYLYDKYLKTFTQLSTADTTKVTISINLADAGSKDANRFSIVGQRQLVLPVTFNSARAYAKAKTAEVEWTVASEIEVQHYEVEKSANGTTFTKAGEVKATGATAYSFNDATPFGGDSYYRVKSVDKSGKATYTKILPVTIETSVAASSFSIYPNPLTGKSFQILLNNKKAGVYTVSLVSSNGQQLFTQTINYNGGSAVYKVQLKQNLASGMYVIKATAADGSTDVIKAIVQ